MNHETAVAMAVILAVIIITLIYSVISGGLSVGETGIGNITERADEDDGGPSFASMEGKKSLIPEESSIKGREATIQV